MGEPTETSPALLAWRSHRRGVLMCGEIPHKTGFAPCPRTGVVAVPLPTTLLSAGAEFSADGSTHFVLFMPDESDTALQVLLTPRVIDPEETDLRERFETPREELRDRWLMLHLEPPRGDAAWVAFDAESARLGREVLDDDALRTFSALHEWEPKLVKRANADRALLACACHAATGSDLTEAIAVEANPSGLLIRHKLGVTLAPFGAEAHDRESAERQIDAMLAKGGA